MLLVRIVTLLLTPLILVSCNASIKGTATQNLREAGSVTGIGCDMSDRTCAGAISKNAPSQKDFTINSQDAVVANKPVHVSWPPVEDADEYVVVLASEDTCSDVKQSASGIKDAEYDMEINDPGLYHLCIYAVTKNGVVKAENSGKAIEVRASDEEDISPDAVPNQGVANASFNDTDVKDGQLSGTVAIAKATDETGLTGYALYWGSDENTKLSDTPIVVLPKTGSDLTYTFPDGTEIPEGATHLLVYTRNGDAEIASGLSLAIDDSSAPSHKAAGFTFTDSDQDRGQVAGSVSISKATDESDLTHYVLYWGTDTSTKKSNTPIATIAKTGANLSHVFAVNTVLPASATHLLVFTKNEDGEMEEPTAFAVVDTALPAHAAASVTFTDGDLDASELSGQVTVFKASDESDVTHYVLYWGSNASTKQSGTPIATLAKTGANVTHTFAADTAVPGGATHLLVYTKNAVGEMSAGVNVALVDRVAPVNAAAGVAFTDSDLDGGELAGTVTISKAANESDVTHYVLYWGSDASTKQSGTPIATLAKTGANVTHTFVAHTALPAGATHLLVFTKNADGEMLTGANVAISDAAVPMNAAAGVSFTDGDLDGDELSGAVTITKAGDESDLTHYVLYWGSDATTKQSGTPIATVAKTGANVTHTFAGDTALPAGATHLLVFTKNADGEMATGVNESITDLAIPVNAAAGVSFTDGDLDGDELSGTVTITKAVDESDVSDYVLYWGSDASTKQSGTPIATLAKSGANVTHTFAADTALPAGASHLLVFTKNADGEMGSGVNLAIDDQIAPVNASAGVSFTDGDLDADELSGTVTISKAADESDVTHYALYWGTDASTKQSGTPIATLAKTGANVTHAFATDTALPAGATHLLVFTRNADGEMATGVNQAIDDLVAPVHAAGGVSFVDSDDTVDEVQGTVTITKATDESDLTHYVLYWGSDATTKQSGTPIISVNKTGANVTHTFLANTPVPGGATHLLVYTKNDDGEMATGVNVAIDDMALPVHSAAGISFTDSDATLDEIQGTLTVTKATDESDVTHYVLYWGSDASTKQSATPIDTIAKTGSDVTHVFAADTPIPAGATHFLVFTKNDDGEMATGTNASITDVAGPTNKAVALSFTDSDPTIGEIQGDVTITKATDESDITHYVLYWGSSATVKQSGTPIDTIAKTGSDITHTFAADTAIPAGATHLLVFTKNANGEMLTGVNVEITEMTGSKEYPANVTFIDYDYDSGEVWGTVRIKRAENEFNVVSYVLYWGSDQFSKNSSTPIATIAKTGGDLTYDFSEDTAVPAGATHLLVYTKDTEIESDKPTAILLADMQGAARLRLESDANTAIADATPKIVVSGGSSGDSIGLYYGSSCDTHIETKTKSDITVTFDVTLGSSGTYTFSTRNITSGVCSDNTLSYSHDGFVAITSVVSNGGWANDGNAYAALRADGSVVAWGDRASGGEIPSSKKSMLDGTNDVTAIYANDEAFAVIHVDGSVTAWGDENYGGTMDAASLSALDGTIDAVSITATKYSFAALRSDGSVVTWGWGSSGGNSSSVASSLDGTIAVTSLVSTSQAFAALRSDGSVITWGLSSLGGDSSGVSSALDGTTDVTNIIGNYSAFAALRSDGSVITWGSSTFGGDSSSVASEIDGTDDSVDVTNLYTYVNKSQGSFAAIRADGSVISWGNPTKGGDSSSVASDLDGTIDVTSIVPASSAYAALRADGSVITWGEAANGGDSSSVASDLDGTLDVTSIVGNVKAFAAIHSDGSVTTWGSSFGGGDSSSVASDLDGTIDVTDIYGIRGAGGALAALRADGSVITWGYSTYGGDSSSVASDLDGTIDVTSVTGGDASAAALRSDGTVITWGDSTTGGDTSTKIAQLTTGTAGVYTTTNGGFAALKSDGSVVTWGSQAYGGDSSSVASDLDGTIDVIDIQSNDYAFAALRADGSVITWNYGGYGGDSSSVATALNGTIDVVKVYAVKQAFAALRADGSVIAWGFGSYGGNTSSVAADLDGTIDVVAIYNTTHAFAALRSDGSVVTWGRSGYGGNSSAVASDIDGTIKVKKIYANDYAFAALREDGSVIAWDETTYGGDTSAISDLDGTIDVINIVGNEKAFAAIRVDGSVVTWGYSSSGGSSSSVSSSLDGTIDVVSISHTINGFAALRADGSVITWGSNGGNSSSVAGDIDGTIDVVSIAANNSAFAATRIDGSVVTWGNSAQGGDSSSLSSALDGSVDVVSVVGSAYAFAALRADGSIVTWGSSDNGGDSSDISQILNMGFVGMTSNWSSFAAFTESGYTVSWGQASIFAQALLKD